MMKVIRTSGNSQSNRSEANVTLKRSKSDLINQRDQLRMVCRDFGSNCHSKPRSGGRLNRKALLSRIRSMDMSDFRSVFNQHFLSKHLLNSHKSYDDDESEISELFTAVENDDIGKVNFYLRKCMHSAIRKNKHGLTALDVASMLNHTEISHILLRNGAQENLELSHLARLNLLQYLIDTAMKKFIECCNQQSNSVKVDKEMDFWRNRISVLKKMKNTVLKAGVPQTPRCSLHVTSSKSLTVAFEASTCHSDVATKYKVEWSLDKHFSKAESKIVVDLRIPKFTIANLCRGKCYYVRVYAGNYVGFSAPGFTLPESNIPSYWRDVENETTTKFKSIQELQSLHEEIKKFQESNLLSQVEDDLKKRRKISIKSMLITNSRLHKSNKHGSFLSVILYKGDKVMCTLDDQIPTVEICDSLPTAVNAEFQWFLKVTTSSERLPSVPLFGRDDFSNFGSLTFRLKLLDTIRCLKAGLGMNNLGSAYHQPLYDADGNIIFVMVKNVAHSKPLQGLILKWQQIDKLPKRISSESTTEEILLNNIEASKLYTKCIKFHKQSLNKLGKGLYLGYLKLESYLNEMKIVLLENQPSIMPYAFMRENSHVSKDEWEWLKALDNLQVNFEHPNACQLQFHWELVSAAKILLKLISDKEFNELRIYRKEVIEINSEISFILLLPPPDKICSCPTEQSAEYIDTLRGSSKISLPVTVFEVVHLQNYQAQFLSLYSYISLCLEVYSSLLKQQQRQILEKNFSSEEKLNQLSLYQHKLESLWKESRWLCSVVSDYRKHCQQKGLDLKLLFDYFEQNQCTFKSMFKWKTHPPNPTHNDNFAPLMLCRGRLSWANFYMNHNTVVDGFSTDHGYDSDQSLDKLCSNEENFSVNNSDPTSSRQKKSDSAISDQLQRSLIDYIGLKIADHFCMSPKFQGTFALNVDNHNAAIDEENNIPEMAYANECSNAQVKKNIDEQVVNCEMTIDEKLTKINIVGQSFENLSKASPQMNVTKDVSKHRMKKRLCRATSDTELNKKAEKNNRRWEDLMLTNLFISQVKEFRNNELKIGEDLSQIDKLFTLSRKMSIVQGKEPDDGYCNLPWMNFTDFPFYSLIDLNNLHLKNNEQQFNVEEEEEDDDDDHDNDNESSNKNMNPDEKFIVVHVALPNSETALKCVKMRISSNVTAKDVVRKVIAHFNENAAERGESIAPIEAESICLVVVIGVRERCLRDNYPVVLLKPPWSKGKLVIRRRVDLLAALECGNEEAV
ncbi:Ankyrin repeat and fibronectin type-III domain-containing protein 1 [Trichinella zimbabwensis]|uniref:Ankyrin repeat and fibronectin type-III domain-containing protein 1 n=1 Tax=Trichinella zimbabwensis TaxID=268475 RepID=A0A0V1I8K3_9BILA|nr:Ankyrin repeat and fibronectin type-III domain-containing protein 1 [Trichinella zimbabwensis]